MISTWNNERITRYSFTQIYVIKLTEISRHACFILSSCSSFRATFVVPLQHCTFVVLRAISHICSYIRHQIRCTMGVTSVTKKLFHSVSCCWWFNAIYYAFIHIYEAFVVKCHFNTIFESGGTSGHCIWIFQSQPYYCYNMWSTESMWMLNPY